MTSTQKVESVREAAQMLEENPSLNTEDVITSLLQSIKSDIEAGKGYGSCLKHNDANNGCTDCIERYTINRTKDEDIAIINQYLK